MFLAFSKTFPASIGPLVSAVQLTRPFRIPINIGNLLLLPMIGLVSCLFMLLQMDISILIVGVMLTIVGEVLSLVSANCDHSTRTLIPLSRASGLMLGSSKKVKIIIIILKLEL